MSVSMRGSMSEGRRSAIRLLRAPGREVAAGSQDSSEVAYGLVQAVVHDHRVELVRADALLFLGLGEAAGDRLLGLAATRLQPAALLGAARRLHEDEQRLGQLPLDRERALDVDLEHHVVPGRDLVAHVVERRPLQVAVHLEPLEEPARVAQRLELLAAHEVVVDTFTLTRARCARRPRNRPAQVGIGLAQKRSDSALSGARRTGAHEHDAEGVGVLAWTTTDWCSV